MYALQRYCGYNTTEHDNDVASLAFGQFQFFIAEYKNGKNEAIVVHHIDLR